MKTQKIFVFRFVFIAILTLALAVSALGLICVNSRYKAKAQDLTSLDLVLPSTNLEYQKLLEPIDSYQTQDNSVTAILVSKHTQQDGTEIDKHYLYLYINGQYQYINTDSTGNELLLLHQLKKLSDSTLLMSSFNTIYKIDLAQNAQITKLLDSDTADIKTNFFDLNEQYLVTASASGAIIYKIDQDKNLSKYKTNFIDTIDGATNPIAINEDNYIFYVHNGVLYKSLINDNPKATMEYVINKAPSAMVANKDYVYYLLDNKLYRISVNGGEPQSLSSQPTEFDLGQISDPKSISFKGEKLLITGGGAIQEFELVETNGGAELKYTGFSIAKSKTAYNRISNSVKEIEREKDKLATLDDNRLTIINVKDGFDPYDTARFEKPYQTQALSYEGKTLNSFALGQSSALLLYDQGKDNSKIKLFNFDTNALSEDIEIPSDNFSDVLYQSGYFYLLTHDDNSSSSIYRIDQHTGEFIKIDGADVLNVYAQYFEVDVFGNIYLCDKDANENNFIYKLEKANNYAITKLNADYTISKTKKLETDLGGNLFVLTENSVASYKANQWTNISFNTSGFKSFAMDYDKKSVYLVYEGQELIVKTEALSNVAIDDIAIPQTFVTTSSTASDNLKTFKSSEQANVYAVCKNENKFGFDRLITQINDYAFITEVEKDGVLLYALAGQDQLVLINSKEVIETTPQKDTLVPQNAFVTTSVNAYYLPIITANSEYSLVDGQTVRLSKEQVISPKHKINFLDKEYYFAEFSLNQKTYFGYVPVDYTIEILSQDFKWNNYTIEKVFATTVYLEKECATAIAELTNGQSVRVSSREDGVCYIAFSTENGWVNGYISAQAIKNDPSLAIRNILIIIAVMASVCGTTTYFILRKKK